MIPTLITALRQIRDDLAKVLEPVALRDLCRSLGVRWRERLLDPVTTIHLFLLQILHGNTACATCRAWPVAPSPPPPTARPAPACPWPSCTRSCGA